MNYSETNKLIAEFMGLEGHPKYNPIEWYIPEYNSGEWYRPEEMRFHESWDWLVPVIHKVQLEIKPEVAGLWRMITHPIEYRIEDVHGQVAEFIKNYSDETL